MVAPHAAPATTAPRRTIKPRTPTLAFDGVPKHWFGGNAVASHIVNGVNLLFPAGERFFVRSVRHYMAIIEKDPELLAQVRGFFGQEGRHAHAHEEYFTILEAQGFTIRPFLAFFEKTMFGFVEKHTGPELHLAATAAAEHFTAILAEHALSSDDLSSAHPVMRKLLMWHAAEEIEHKAVAFDVLQRVNPSYALRMAGLAVAALTLSAFWTAGTLMLVAQDGLPLTRAGAELGEARKRRMSGGTGGVFARGIRQYVRRGFHPAQNDDYALAERYFAAAE